MSSRLERKFRDAVSCFQARDLAGAERLCRAILGKAPRHPEALHLLGMVRLAGGNAREAVALIERAVERDPRNPAVLESLGVARLADGDAVVAETVFRRALKLGASHAILHMRLALALMSQHRLTEAVAELRAAAKMAPDDPDVLLNFGNALAEEGLTGEALDCYRKILASHPDHVHARYNIATQLRRMGRHEEAIAAYQSLLALAPAYADAHHNLGTIYYQQGRLDDAVGCFRKVLALDADHLQSLNSLGNVLRKQGHLLEAVALYERALEVNPAHVDAYINLGNARGEQYLYAQARALFEKALSLEPGNVEAQENLGHALSALQLWEDAIPQFERALALNPASALARFGLGLARLFRQEFEQAWPDYELRLERPGEPGREDPASVVLYKELPRWRGPAGEGEREVAIWTEQGIGDQVLHSTLIPELIGAGMSFIYEVDRRLLGAYQRAFPGHRFIPYADPPHASLQQASRVLLAGSLPGLFRRVRADFSRQPRKLLSALPERVAHYRSRLDALGPRLKVAFSWASARKDHWGRAKSVPLREFAPLLKLSGVHFVDAQYGDTAAERRAVEDATGVPLLHFDEVDYRNDLEEVLAILEACDLLITLSNATAHFAGALGKRTWLLYPGDRAAFYYWAHGGSFRSLWYPSVEIVTDRHLTEWPSLIGHVVQRVARELAGAGQGHA